MIQSLVGRLFASGPSVDPPLCVHIDEGHNVLYPIQEIFNKAGGANVWLHFYEQSGAQMSAEIGADLARSISDNINSWIYFQSIMLRRRKVLRMLLRWCNGHGRSCLCRQRHVAFE